MKRSCELCKNLATIYCESDQASLCWTCDAKVHSANFLVGRHSRNLLCHVCQNRTPWTASGLKLGPTLSVCKNCFHGEEKEESNDGPVDEESEDDDDDDDVVEEEEENQVVPWSVTPSSSAPPAASSSTSSDESTNGQPEVSRKRVRASALDRWCNEDTRKSCQNIRTPPILTEGAAETKAVGDASGGVNDDDSSSRSRRGKMRPLKARRIESGRADKLQ